MRNRISVIVAMLMTVMLALTGFSISAMAETTTMNIHAGDTIFLGQYEQDNNKNNGSEPIEWTVLKVDGDQALVISFYVLDCQPYSTQKGENTWESSTLRTWLNSDFFTAAFTSDEAAVIQSTTISNGQSEQPVLDKWEGKGGNDTTDKVWLLSYTEVKQMLASTRVVGTEYANAQGAKANIFASESNWYTRSVGKKQDQASFIHDNFDPQSAGVGDKKGIRPAMWISLTADWSSFPYGQYQSAVILAEQGNYIDAYHIADSLGSYNNSVSMSAQYRYDYAKSAMTSKDYATALSLFNDYSAFATSNNLKLVADYDTDMPECYNQLALECIPSGNHDKAISYFKTLGDYSAAKAATYWFDYAATVMNNGDYASAITLFQGYNDFATEKKIKIPADYAVYYPDCFDKLARQNLTTGEHDKAIELYKQLGTYNATKAAEYWFAYATSVKESGDLITAVSLYLSYHDYITEQKVTISADYNTNLPECYYQLAMAAKNSGDYKTAIKYFSEISQYSDAMDQIRACFDKTHTQYRWLTQNNGSVVNAGTKGYSESKAISGDDPHFGWNLGRFMMSGYTEVDESGNYPTFIKTPGDNLVLWFDLNMDIDALNGNTDLKIAEDTDGFDQALGFSKTNMGRGALLMKHTDFRNSDGTPIAYLDYLSAKESGVANTRVEVKEEGIYEVALDYEIHDGNLTHVFSSTNNYRIYFKFAVKNGSAMFYMFDIASGAELEDYSRTAEGFRIDLANSHSLKVDVVRYAMNQSYTGLDVRANAPASDGDEFNRTGYYEITIENSETGEKMTKHIFVGNKGDLAEFQDVDTRLSLFGK